MDTIVSFEFTSCLDALPGRRNLDKDTLLLDAYGFIQGNQFSGFSLSGFLVKGEARIDLSRDTARDNREDFFAKFYQLKRVCYNKNLAILPGE